MRNQYGFLRDLKSVQRGAIATVGDVDRHSDFVHPLDDGDAEIRNAIVASLGRAVADQVAGVVGQLGDALADTVKEVDVVWPAKLFGVLQADADADLARRLHAIEVGRTVNAHYVLIVVGDKTVPSSKHSQCTVVSVRSAKTNGDVKDVDAGIFVRLQVGSRETLGIREPAVLFRKVEREWTEHVDNNRLLDQIDRS